MAGPGINLVGEEEIEEVLEILHSRYPDGAPAHAAHGCHALSTIPPARRTAAKYLGIPASAV